MSKRILVTVGDILKTEFLEPLNITPYRLAKSIGKSRTTIKKIISGENGISADMAIRLAMFFNTTPDFWLNIQLFCELEKAEEKMIQENVHILSYDSTLQLANC